MTRVAFFTPLSPVQSALADYAEGLALGLAHLPDCQVDFFINDDYQPDNPVIRADFAIFTYQEFEKRARAYDVCLYSMGDQHAYHGYMLNFVRRYPGVLILNDLTLHRCIMNTAFVKGEGQTYLSEMQDTYGVGEDMRIASQIKAGYGDQLILRYPLFEGLVNHSLAVVLQNHFAQQQVLAACPNARVEHIPYPFFMPPGFPPFELTERREQQRRSMNIAADEFVVGSFGIFVPNKHLESCLNAFRDVVAIYPHARYILGGFPIGGYDLLGEIQKAGLQDRVLVTGWLPPIEFAQYMFALDVGIHLRHPHIGGTPYTPFRLMGLDVCTIVSDIEPLAELPQGACIKIVPDHYQAVTLSAILCYLAQHPDFCKQVAGNGREIIARDYTLAGVAERFGDLLRAVARPS